MPACHAGGRGFEPLPDRIYASVAQSVEQETENLRVGGSIPPRGIFYAVVAQLVERHLAKVEVASPSLVYRFFYWIQCLEPSPSGKAKVCKTFIPGPNPGGSFELC